MPIQPLNNKKAFVKQKLNQNLKNKRAVCQSIYPNLTFSCDSHIQMELFYCRFIYKP